MTLVNDTKVALITGGSRGIGEAMVKVFAEAGYAVAFTYAANKAAADALTATIAEGGGKAVGFGADVRDFARAADVIKEAQEKLGPITALVNNAGIKKDMPLMRMDPTAWQDVIDTNLTGHFQLHAGAGRGTGATRRFGDQCDQHQRNNRHGGANELQCFQGRNHWLYARAGEGSGAVRRASQCDCARVY